MGLWMSQRINSHKYERRERKCSRAQYEGLQTQRQIEDVQLLRQMSPVSPIPRDAHGA